MSGINKQGRWKPELPDSKVIVSVSKLRLYPVKKERIKSLTMTVTLVFKKDEGDSHPLKKEIIIFLNLYEEITVY